MADATLVPSLGWAVLVGLLVAISWVDWRSQRIPNGLNAGLLTSGLVVSGLTGEPGLVASGIGALLGGSVLLAVALGFRRWRSRDGLGLGDVKFMVAAGAWTGWQGVGPTVSVAACAALAVVGMCTVAGATIEPQRRIAFGVYLSGALVVVLLLQRLDLI